MNSFQKIWDHILTSAGSTMLWQSFTVIASLGLVGIYSRVCDPADFAIFLLAQGLVAASALFELGISRSLLYYMTRYSSNANKRLQMALAAQMLLLLLVIVVWVGALIVGLAVSYLIGWSPKYFALAVVVLASLPFGLLGLAYITDLESDGRFKLVAKLRFMSAILIYSIPLIVYNAEVLADGYMDLLLGIFIAKASTFLFIWKFSRVRVGLRLSGLRVNMRLLFRYGKWVGISNVLSVIFSQGDRLILTSMSGLGALAAYIPYSDLVQKASMLSNSLMRILFVASLRARNTDKFHIERRVLMILVVSLGPFLILVWSADSIAKLWLGDGVDNTGIDVFRILLLSMWIKLFAQLFVNKLYGRNKAYRVTQIHFIEIAPFLIGVTFGAYHYGAIGVAVAVLLREIVDAFLLGWNKPRFVKQK